MFSVCVALKNEQIGFIAELIPESIEELAVIPVSQVVEFMQEDVSYFFNMNYCLFVITIAQAKIDLFPPFSPANSMNQVFGGPRTRPRCQPGFISIIEFFFSCDLDMNPRTKTTMKKNNRVKSNLIRAYLKRTETEDQ